MGCKCNLKKSEVEKERERETTSGGKRNKVE